MSSSFSDNLKNLAPIFNYTPKERTMSTVSLLSTDVMTLKRSLVLLIKNKGLPAATFERKWHLEYSVSESTGRKTK